MIDELAHQAALIAAVHPLASRLRHPGEVVARMRPRFAEFGITRLAEVTGLDRVGWPVWAAVRPNASTLSVSQGKGPTAEAAQASALMEAVEIAAAEGAAPARLDRAATLTHEGESLDLLPGLVRRGHEVPASHEAVGWLPGHDLVARRDVWVPAQAVQIDATDPRRAYWQSSDGLGSGSLMIEAVLHGLCERIERDAGELWILRGDHEVAEACVDPDGLDSDPVSAASEAVARAGLHLRLFDITSDVGVPAYFATVSPVPNGRETHWRHFDLASGMGCRPLRAEAALAAIGEALQSRLTTISGARDDFQPGAYRHPVAPDILVYPRCRPRRQGARTVEADQGIEGRLPWLLGRLAAAGVGRVVVVPLHEDADCAVAKVLVPGLEHPPGARAVPFGPRLRRAMGPRP